MSQLIPLVCKYKTAETLPTGKYKYNGHVTIIPLPTFWRRKDVYCKDVYCNLMNMEWTYQRRSSRSQVSRQGLWTPLEILWSFGIIAKSEDDSLLFKKLWRSATCLYWSILILCPLWNWDLSHSKISQALCIPGISLIDNNKINGILIFK